jgi:hypothetical protein
VLTRRAGCYGSKPNPSSPANLGATPPCQEEHDAGKGEYIERDVLFSSLGHVADERVKGIDALNRLWENFGRVATHS